MTPLPIALGGAELIAWRLDQAAYAPTWDSGEGAYRVGGRWNSKGVRAVYCSIDPSTIPNPNWLRPGIPSAGQQAFGDELLRKHAFVAIPSAVSTHSWNLLFVASAAPSAYALKFQEPFALDTRLHPPSA